jgi:hypothetical protein
MLGFDSFETAEKTICRIEVFHRIRKGQVEEIEATEKVLSSKKGIFSHSLWELYLFCDIIIVSNSSRWIL